MVTVTQNSIEVGRIEAVRHGQIRDSFVSGPEWENRGQSNISRLLTLHLIQ